MVASGRVRLPRAARRRLWVHTGPISIDLRKVRERKRNIVDKFRNGVRSRIEKGREPRINIRRCQVYRSKTVEVRTKDAVRRGLSAKYIFINAGTRARVPGSMAWMMFRLWTTPPSWNSILFPITC